MNTKIENKYQKEIFNLKDCPLTGSNLLEAGAGTGKTYSLAFLYLRLLLEKGLTVEEILVTTFTNAATAELKERIFATIQSADKYVNDINTSLHHDDFLVSVLDDIRTQLSDEDITKRLRLAIAQFDYAKIFTIDGFALQLLHEYADVLHTYIPEDIISDDSEYVKKAYLELARDEFSAFGADALRIGKAVADFDEGKLFTLLSQMLTYRDYIDNSNDEIFTEIEYFKTLIQKAQQINFKEGCDIITQLLEDKILNGRRCKKSSLQKYIDNFDPKTSYIDKNFLTFFSSQTLHERLNDNQSATFDHPLFCICNELLTNIDTLSLIQNIEKYKALLQLTKYIQQRVTELKAEQMVLNYNDITRRVAQGAKHIYTPLKAALIDEAQDTSSEHMQLFTTLFLQNNGENNERHEEEKIVFFVGDPKQAIYGFRGANIYSYLAIQEQVQHHYIMDTNYRSTQALNDSINTFFSGHNPFLNEKVHYHTIKSHKDNDSVFADTSLSLITAEDGKAETLAKTAAHAIAHTLQTYQGEIQPKDIAVLVRKTDQAKKVKAELAEIGISASFTGKIGIYETDEAKLFLYLLQAIHSGDIRLIKSLMLTPLFSYSIDDVKNSDIVNQLCKQLQSFAELYERRGLSIMFYQLVKQFSLAGRLLQSDDGKRRLTNFIQIFEILQGVLQKQSLSLAGLCDTLAKRISEQDTEAELRLEDDEAVTIMTIHTSKGLEFPIVCLPFFEFHTTNNSNDGLVVNHQGKMASPKFIQPDKLKQKVLQEEEAEQRRLAYVALTRAKYHNIIIRQPADSNAYKKGSMLTMLLDTLNDPTQLTQGNFVAKPIELTKSDEQQREETVTNNKIKWHAQQLEKPLYSEWLLSSFSRMQYEAEQQRQQHGQQLVQNHSKETRQSNPDNSIDDTALIHYPAGPNPGTALHEMYEHLLAYRENNEAFITAVRNSTNKHLSADDKKKLPELSQLAEEIITTTNIALAPYDFCLSDVEKSKQSIEMKFFMHLPPAARHNLLQRFEIDNHTNFIIPSIHSNGYVHGYIDYCFEHQGKFYVLDYKSNRLGTTADDYNYDNMHAEMQHHRYDLQALIYTLALCKHLRITTQEQYEEKIGGYFYLFIRGMRANRNTGIYFDTIAWQDICPLL